MSLIVGLPPKLTEKIRLTGSCWLWTGGLSDGYGRIVWSGKRYKAHRLVYMLMVGPIPPGMTIDHLCRVRACVNPNHLECVSLVENVLRGEGACAQHRRKENCPKCGGVYEQRSNGRHCTTCAKVWRREYHQRNREKHLASFRRYWREVRSQK